MIDKTDLKILVIAASLLSPQLIVPVKGAQKIVEKEKVIITPSDNNTVFFVDDETIVFT